MFGKGAVVRAKPLNLIIDLQPLDQTQLDRIDRLAGSLSASNILPTWRVTFSTGRARRGFWRGLTCRCWCAP